MPGRTRIIRLQVSVSVAFFLLAHTFTAMECAASQYLYLGEKASDDPELLTPAPADGDTVDIDAPGFSWLAEGGSGGFILEISRSRDFPEHSSLLKQAVERTELTPPSLYAHPQALQGESSWLIAGLPLPLYHPSFQLGPGYWYWRWRCVFPGGEISPPSAARRFFVTRDAISYTVPSLEQLFSRIPARHPRLFVRPENLDSLRALLRSSAPHRNLYRKIEAFADSLLRLPIMEEPLPFPDGRGAYQNKTQSKYLIYRKYYDQARKMGQVLDFLGFCYMITGERKWSARARDWLMSLTQWDIDGPSSMVINDEVAMPIFLNGARAYDWIYDALTIPEREAIRTMLRERGKKVFDTVYRQPFHHSPYGSHEVRLINYLSQAACVLYGEADEARRWLSYVIPVVTTFYPPWGGNSGGYAEGPSYWK
ncbi:DUF4962 domain-containing protein, partial [Gemmatimonadota bacterium]